jgi:protein-disulfide isomerase
MIARALGLVLLMFAYVSSVTAQFYGDKQPDKLANTSSILKSPAGVKVAVIEFEDLECPPCAEAYPIVSSAIAQYHVPLIRYDFPLKSHVWSFDAAVMARWMRENVSETTAGEFRKAIFASQSAIANKDDLQTFAHSFATQHKFQLPSKIDPDSRLANEVAADRSVGERLRITGTPTIVVVTDTEYQIVSGNWPANKTELTDLPAVIEGAFARSGVSNKNTGTSAR